MAGVFAHEAFGHFSEADIIENLPGMREKMKIGEKLGSDVLSIVDDATRKNQVGFYRYDDEGVAVRPVPLITDGILTGRLHSRRTAAAFGEPVSGHHIAEDYRYAPIVRMGCIFIEPGEPTFAELLVSMSIMVILSGVMTSVIVLAGHALPDSEDPAEKKGTCQDG